MQNQVDHTVDRIWSQIDHGKIIEKTLYDLCGAIYDQNMVAVKQCTVFIMDCDAQCNQKLRIVIIERT